MSDIIRLLPDSVANQIAAGEVIQRPASVIKELVENSVDAGSTYIRIIIKDAGRTLIQVVDNGKGMSPTDARMAFERHATSKISNAKDLFSLHTMGFRGEALPSVCAISQIEVKTKTPEDPMGTRLIINGSKVESQEPVICDSGTNMMVKNLFFNVPARRKFLKSDSVEMSNILREFERLALVNNNIRMSLEYGEKRIDLRAATFKQRITDIWKNSIDKQLLPIEVDTAIVKISGFVSRPEFAKRRNPLQYLIVNGRNMRHPYFHKAVLSCYDSLIATDTQPCYFLKFEVDPSSIDVNIHPTKNEIKFEYEQQIWPILKASVKAALGHFGAVPSLDFTTDILPVKKLNEGEKPVQPKINLDPNYTPFISTEGKLHNKERGKVDREWESLYSDFMSAARGFGEQNSNREEKSLFPQDEADNSVGNLCIQHDQRFIITSALGKLTVIDQRKAHLKILYEDYLSHLEKNQIVTRKLMFPEYIQLDSGQAEVFPTIEPELRRIGFEIEFAGDSGAKISSVPAIIDNVDYADLVLSIYENIMDDDSNYGREVNSIKRINEKIALTMARKSAIPVKVRLTEDEMEHIVGRLFSLEQPGITPDGNRIFMTIESSQLESFFN